MSQFPAVIELSSLDGTNGFRIDGLAAYDNSGWSVASAGDINGDGFADLVIGARNANGNLGASYVVFGGASGFGATFNLSSLDGNNGFELKGTGDGVGLSVASAGDINGDGFDDLIVGANNSSSHAYHSGSSYIVFGRAAGFDPTLNPSSLDGSNGFTITGVAASDHSGCSVASAGDVNGDGFADLIIGAFGADPHGSYSGASYVVFGHAGGFGATLNLSSLDGSNGFKISGEKASNFSGSSVASAGDVNGDGFDDLIIGATGASPHGANSGATYVVFGQAGGFGATLDLSSLNGSNGFEIDGAAAADISGFSVASAGDINGDGFADLIIGAISVATPTSQGFPVGAAYVVFGHAGGFDPTLDVSALDGTNGFVLYGEHRDDSAGWSVASAGDVNGDGFEDVIVGAVDNSPNGVYSGASYVVFGKAGGFDAAINLSSLDGSNGFKLDGVTASDRSGRSVASAGDVNGDGFGDLIVGATGANPNGNDSGSSYVIFGIMPDAAVDRMGTDASQTLAGGNFDDTLLGRGGNDSLYGNGGNDVLNGGSGRDTAFYSDATSGVTVNLSATGPQDVGGGAGIDTLISIENVTGSAFADRLIGNSGSNVLTGGGGNDTFILNSGGRDVVLGGAGDDRIFFGASFTAADHVDGGDGNDMVVLNGDYSAGVKFGPQTMVNVETIHFVAGHSYSLTTNDATVAAGQTLTVNGGALGPGDTLTFSGARELDGNFIIAGGAGNDVLHGGAGNDTITGGLGADDLNGGLGADTFVYMSAAQSTGPNYDTVGGFDFAGADKFDLNATVSAIDTKIAGGALSTASFDSDLAASVDGAHLGRHDAVLFTPDSGDLAGKIFLIVDANNVAGYQAGQDYVIALDGSHYLSSIDVTDFV